MDDLYLTWLPDETVTQHVERQLATWEAFLAQHADTVMPDYAINAACAEQAYKALCDERTQEEEDEKRALRYKEDKVSRRRRDAIKQAREERAERLAQLRAVCHDASTLRILRQWEAEPPPSSMLWVYASFTAVHGQVLRTLSQDMDTERRAS